MALLVISLLSTALTATGGDSIAAWALLQQLGLEVYPWYAGPNQGAVEVFTPVAGGMLKPFDHSDKPFFEHRDLIYTL